MPTGRERSRALGDLFLHRALFPSERGIGSLGETFSDGETQAVDCASSMFQHEGPAWQKVSACWAPTEGPLHV